MPTILFPASPLSARDVDPDFEAEMVAARSGGFDVGLIRLEALLGGDAAGSIQGLRKPDSTKQFLYRGWMITSAQYRELISSLESRGYEPFTSPLNYAKHHEYPGAWSALSHMMPRSFIAAEELLGDIENVLTLASQALAGPALIKDFVKSRKHEWAEACFVPDIADRSAAGHVVRTFLERQGETLQGGLVFRQMLDLVGIGNHPKSQLPLPLEYRAFFICGKLLCSLPYWDEVEYVSEIVPPAAFLDEIARGMGDGFYTADVALSTDGRWYVIELGDGQVSQIPDRLAASEFYARLRSNLALGMTD